MDGRSQLRWEGDEQDKPEGRKGLNTVGVLEKDVYIFNVLFTEETDMLRTLINMLCSIINENVGFSTPCRKKKNGAPSGEIVHAFSNPSSQSNVK